MHCSFSNPRLQYFMNEPECRGDMRVDILLGGSEHLDCLFTRELRPIGVHITSRRTRYRIVIVSWLSLSTEERQELCGSLNSQYLLCVTCDALYFLDASPVIGPVDGTTSPALPEEMGAGFDITIGNLE